MTVSMKNGKMGHSSQASGSLKKNIYEDIKIKTFKCKECGKVYNYQKLLRHHIENSHKRYYNCEKCNKAYNNLPQLKQHIKSAHEGHRYKCGLCDRDFKSHEAYKQHIHMEGQRYKCDL